VRIPRNKIKKFDIDELDVAVILVGNLDPDKYMHPEAKAIINKCRAYLDDDFYLGWRLTR
jgi:uroporphyrinogen-III decarboxylase